MRVRELAEFLGAAFEGDGEKELEGVAPLEAATPNDLSFVSSKKAGRQAEASAAGCLIVPCDYSNSGGRTVIRAEAVRTAFARAARQFYPPPKFASGIHPTAVIGAG